MATNQLTNQPIYQNTAQFFQVSMRNKRSRHQEITEQEALEIIATTADAHQDVPADTEQQHIDDSLPMELGGDDDE